MSDVEYIFLVLAALYLWQCCVWLPADARAFSSLFGRTYNPRPARGHLSNESGGLTLSNPFPTAKLLVCEPWPISVSPAGALGFVAGAPGARERPPQTEVYIPFEEFRTVEAVEREIRVNGRRIAKTGNPQFAQWLSGMLRELAAAPVEKRGALLDGRLNSLIDVKKAGERLADLRKETGSLAFMGTALFLWIFAAGPALYYKIREQPSASQLAPSYFIGLAFLWFWSAAEYYFAHKALYPARKGERRKHLAEALLIPVTAIRAADKMAQPLLQPLHPLTAAGAACKPEVFRIYARQTLLDLRHPMEPLTIDENPPSAECERWFRENLTAKLEAAVVAQGFSLGELFQPPAHTDPSATAYCPRCEREFQNAQTQCEDCGGIALKRFAQ